jgi:putative nucleotidyltransferase with HDIG domain
MNACGMLENIKAHSLKVEKVARVLALNLKEAGVSISLEKVSAGALMHDIGKTICLDSSEDHAEKGKEICLENNFHEIADIVEEHIRLKNYNPDDDITEKEIIYYSDKRVNHSDVVSLEKRIEYLLERYAKNDQYLKRKIKENFVLCEKVEKKIFSILSFTPDDLFYMTK